jgi:hypothetical protein
MRLDIKRVQAVEIFGNVRKKSKLKEARKAMYVSHNIEARPGNHCCLGDNNY